MPDLKLWGEHQLSRMKRDMDRMFEALCVDFGLPPARPFGDTGMDLSESPSEVIIRVKVPDLNPADLDVSVLQRRVVIQGRKVQQTDHEIHSETFRRELYLPCPVTAKDVVASYDDGIVEIRIPKRVALRCGLPLQRG